jgi:hypothetical protein
MGAGIGLPDRSVVTTRVAVDLRSLVESLHFVREMSHHAPPMATSAITTLPLSNSSSQAAIVVRRFGSPRFDSTERHNELCSRHWGQRP